jgi:hypothetical protein
MVMDHYQEKWYPQTLPSPIPFPVGPQPAQISPEEVEEFRRLLERAREYDRRNGEPDCELDEKRLALKKLAKELGVEISFL